MAVGKSMNGLRAAALSLSSITMALSAAPTAAFAQAIPIYAESPADALARNVRTLAKDPTDFNALIGAGKAALQIGDAQAAAGFFGRAQERWASSPLPLVGMGAALVHEGDANGALTHFRRAEALGASVASFGADRGLAYDLLGRHAEAQADYRAALAGADRDEARRRLALSLAIVGKKDEALMILQPLLARADSAAARCRALVLALSGDTEGAKRTLDARMPGSAAAMGPFFRSLPTLSSPQKAAAVNLGIFPGSGTAMASASTGGAQSYGDRLASIDQLLTQPQPQAQPQTPRYNFAVPAPTVQPQPPPVSQASVSRGDIEAAASRSNRLVETDRVPSSPGSRKIWLQLASGSNAGDLPDRFEKIRARRPSLFDGISGYVADDKSRSRLVIGPFHTDEDARLFAEALETVRIKSFRWVSSPEQVVRKLSTQ